MIKPLTRLMIAMLETTADTTNAASGATFGRRRYRRQTLGVSLIPRSGAGGYALGW